MPNSGFALPTETFDDVGVDPAEPVDVDGPLVLAELDVAVAVDAPLLLFEPDWDACSDPEVGATVGATFSQHSPLQTSQGVYQSYHYQYPAQA
jgi:hypothetical protein